VDKDDREKRRVPRMTVDVFAQIARFGVLPNSLLDMLGTER
jgi:hypothetical protein